MWDIIFLVQLPDIRIHILHNVIYRSMYHRTQKNAAVYDPEPTLTFYFTLGKSLSPRKCPSLWILMYQLQINNRRASEEELYVYKNLPINALRKVCLKPRVRIRDSVQSDINFASMWNAREVLIDLTSQSCMLESNSESVARFFPFYQFKLFSALYDRCRFHFVQVYWLMVWGC